MPGQNVCAMPSVARYGAGGNSPPGIRLPRLLVVCSMKIFSKSDECFKQEKDDCPYDDQGSEQKDANDEP